MKEGTPQKLSFYSRVNEPEEEDNKIVQIHNTEMSIEKNEKNSTEDTKDNTVNSAHNTEDYVTEQEANAYIMRHLRVDEDQATKIVENIRRPNGTITQTVLNNLLDRVNKA